MRSYKGAFASLTDVGKVRISNEDQAAALTNSEGEVFLLICDGMGGQNKGDCASKLARDFLVESFLNKRAVPAFLLPFWISRSVKKANKLIYEQANANQTYKDMGTTCCLALISKSRLYVCNVGDSRAYWLHEGELSQLTQDQTYVDYLYRTGKISKDETSKRPDRHVLLNALGIYPSSSSDIRVYRYQGEKVLLCSDGLYNNLEIEEMRAILLGEERPDEKVASLIEEANASGGSDNIAVAYFEAYGS